MTTQLSVQISVKSNKYNFSITPTPDLKFRNNAEAKEWHTRYITKFLTDHPDIAPQQLRQINKQGVLLKDGQTVAHPELVETNSPTLLSGAQKSHLTWKTSPTEPTVPKPSKFHANQGKINKPEKPETTPGIGTVTFAFTDEVASNHLPARPRWKNDFLSKAAAIKAEFCFQKMQARASGKKVTSTIKQETQFGIDRGSNAVKNYQEIVRWKRPFEEHFGQKETSSTEIIAHNSPLNGTKTPEGPIVHAFTSSFDRLADTVSLMREVRADDGSSDCYAGRVDTLDKAKEMAEFIFLGEIDAFENRTNLSKGIHQNKDGTYELTFAVQSLLTMSKILAGDQRNRFYQEVEAYQQLIQETKDCPLEIRHPKTGKIYRVQINPLLPIAANQFNLSNRLEGLGLGKTTAKRESMRADEILFKLAGEKIQKLKDRKKIERIQHTIKTLNDPDLLPWQVVMTRAYLCHLLDLPQVVHCLSSVDRTGGVAIPIIVAMKQWLRSKAPIPKRIHEIATTPLPGQSEIYPFRYLCYYKMLHELKISQLSRGPKGFKIKEAGLPNPAAKYIFPQELFKKRLGITLWDDHNGKVGSHHHLFTGRDSES